MLFFDPDLNTGFLYCTKTLFHTSAYVRALKYSHAVLFTNSERVQPESCFTTTEREAHFLLQCVSALLCCCLTPVAVGHEEFWFSKGKYLKYLKHHGLDV